MPENLPSQNTPNRVEVIEALNANSWLMQGESGPEVSTSVTSVGPPRNAETGEPTDRTDLAGNLSPNYGSTHLSSEDKAVVANENVNKFIESLGYEPKDVVIMRPGQDEKTEQLKCLSVNDPSIVRDNTLATWIPEQSDMIYTRNPNTLLAVRAADCIVVTIEADTPDGKIMTQAHTTWRQAKAGYMQQMLEHCKSLNMNLTTAKFYVAAGVAPENFPFTFRDGINPDPDGELKDLFTSLKQSQEDGSPVYTANIDMPLYFRKVMKDAGIEDWQIYQDMSDAAALESGYSSHSRAVLLAGTPRPELESRHMILAHMSK